MTTDICTCGHLEQTHYDLALDDSAACNMWGCECATFRPCEDEPVEAAA